MQVLIIGAGTVGTNIATNLTEHHDVTIVEAASERVDELTQSFDGPVIEGDGRSVATLEDAGVVNADMVIASTASDEANVMICSAVNTVTETVTIARVKKADFYNVWQRLDGAFGVDHMICVNRLCAEQVVQTVTQPGATTVDTFVDGQVEMAAFEVTADSPIANQTVEEADRSPSLSAFTIAAILRDDDVLLPTGETEIEPGETAVVIGAVHNVKRFATAFDAQPAPDPQDEIVILGGGEVGYQTARLFEERGFTPRLVARDSDRIDELTNQLPKTDVRRSTTTYVEFLSRTPLDDIDVLISALDDDMKNYLSIQLATQFDINHIATVLNTNDYLDLFEAAEIERIVRPRRLVSQEITRFAYEGPTEHVSIVPSETAEIIEVEVNADSTLAGQPLRQVGTKFPAGFVVGAIVRDGTVELPRGNTYIQSGDHIVAFVDADIVDDVMPKL
jgi:trk system potassium uptake protein TrkA